MKFTRLVALFLTLAVPCVASAQQSKKPRPNTQTAPGTPKAPQPRPSLSPAPPRMSAEKAFYYFVAMFGFRQVLFKGGPDDPIEIYGKSFDANNYERAMADEFERNRYKERIRTRIADEVSKIDFNEKFTFIAQATLGEYSFERHSFPFVWDMFQEYRFCVGPRYDTGARDCKLLDVIGFRVRDSVNGNDFDWSVQMSDNLASAFVKSRSTGRDGKLDRRIALRITYSIVNNNRQDPGANLTGQYSHPIFSPFIYSVEAYADESLTRKLGALSKINPSTVEEWRLAKVAAQTATKEIGKYRYRAASESRIITKLENPLHRTPNPPLFGMITLTDVGVTLSGEQPGGGSERKSFTFFDSFALAPSRYNYGPALELFRITQRETSLWRANYARAEDFRVVWRPFWDQDYYSALVFKSVQERDRFFVDLQNALQEWKTKYASFQFAAGKVNIYSQCEVNTRFIPCSESDPFNVR